MALVVLLAAALSQAAAGIVLLRAIFAIHGSWKGSIGLGSTFGILFALLASQVSLWLGLGTTGWLLLPITAIALLLFPSLRARYSQGKPVEPSGAEAPRWLDWLPAAAASLLLQIPNWLRTPIRDGYVVGDRYHSDLVFFEAVGQSVSLLGPSDSLLLSDAPIKYHWFVYGWSGLLTRLSGVDPFWVQTRLLPFVLIGLSAFLAAQWARQLSNVRWVPALAAWLVVVAGYVGADQGVIVTFDSPSNGFASVVLLAFVLTVTLAFRSTDPRPLILLTGFWGFALVGSKASHAAVAGIGVACMALALTLRRERDRAVIAWSLTLATAIGVFGAYLLLLAGISGSDSQIGFGGETPRASTFQGLDPATGLWGVFIGTVVLILAMAPRWVGLVVLLRDPLGRSQPETWLGLGMLVAGIVPLFLLTSGVNAAWFALGASAPLSVLSAVGIGVLRKYVSIPVTHRGWLLVGVVITAAFAWALTVVNYGLVQVSGAPVAWRSAVVAWLTAGIGALVLSLWLRGRWVLRISFALMLAISLTAVASRLSGPVLWIYAAPYLEPGLRTVVTTLDPNAELNARGEPPRSLAAAGSAPRSMSARIASSDPVDTDLADSSTAVADDRVQWNPIRATAASVLRDAAAISDVVAMDASISQPFLPIATDLRVLLAGQPYTDGYTSASAARSIPERFELVDDFRLTAAPAAHQALWDLGVRWLWLEFSPEVDADRLARLTTPLTVGPEVAVLRLNDPGANFS